MVFNVLAGGFVLLVLILMFLTRSGQPRRRHFVGNDPSFIWFTDGSGGDSGCGSDGGGCGDGGGGGGD